MNIIFKITSIIAKIFKLMHFSFILIIIFAFGLYVGIVLCWLILGAMINPKEFLVYTTSAITFVTVFGAKYKSFTTLNKNGLA